MLVVDNTSPFTADILACLGQLDKAYLYKTFSEVSDADLIHGAEIIALTLGGSICKMPAHVQGLTVVSVSIPNRLMEGKKSILVYESHGYCIAKLPVNFKSLASSKYCEHEVFASDSKIYGTQFHPEKSGSDGLALLKNFSRI